MSRDFGILLPVFSLPAAAGIGDFGPEAYRFADLLAEHGAAYWQILPLNPGNPANGESPYFSISAFAINPLLISLAGLEAQGLLTAQETAALPALSPDTIRYDELRAAKLPLLEKAAARFPDGDAAFEAFCRDHRHWLDDFAVFDVLHDEQSGPWTEWPAAFRDRRPQALAEFAAARAREIRVRKVIQFFAGSQWRDLHRYCANQRITLVGDMPIYVALDSADTWTNPGLFKFDGQRRPLAVSGVPPDYFSATGQLWNNPVYAWDAHRADGFAWWIRRLRRLFSLYDIVRIDHFRGLVQYWEIPAGEPTAVNGAWKDVPTREFFNTLLAEFKPFPVICEDLGVITDDVRAVMKHYGLPGMKVLQFAFSDDDPENPYLPANYDGACWVYTGTHDNPPTCGWLRDAAGEAEKARIARRTGRRSDALEMTWDLIELALQSTAAAAIVPLQDVLGLDGAARINNPAVMPGNWRWRWNSARHPARSAFGRLLQLGKKHGRIRA